jgi:hypothetical protein
MTSSVKNSMPQLVWWMTNHSPGAQQLVGDHERADGIVAGPPAGVADHVGVTLAEAGVLGRVEPGVHAGEDGEPAGGGQGQLRLVTERGGVGLIGGEHFIELMVLVGFLPGAPYERGKAAVS